MGDEKHYPRIMFDGISHRAVCTCLWSSNWRTSKDAVEEDWAHHAIKTMQHVVNRRSFVISRNPVGEIN